MTARRTLAPALLTLTAALASSIGLSAVADPAHADGRATIYVSPSGTDTWSRITAASSPVASIARAIRLAEPGDRIVVRGGTYTEAAGYGARPGRQSAPITLTAAKGQRVVLKGTLQLENADYWMVSGINVTQNPKGDRKEFLVKFDGGTGWRFTDAEVWGTRGVSNIMFSASAKNGTPSRYRITGYCIHDNNATGDPFMNDHLIYLMPGYNAGSGVIARNIFYNSENGAAIKAAGPTRATGASNVTIERNTIVRTAAGVIVGFGSNGVVIKHNAIGDQVKKAPKGAQWVANYRSAVVGNHLSGARNRAFQNTIWGFPGKVWSSKDSSRTIATSSLSGSRPAFTSTSSCSGFRPKNATAREYGRWSS